ncbi:unnamed protein product [Lupinus luteus]|uniref:Uncharacterized protein n=1 Tax=Lupinus luteus TaxID=3873 RepID=A0AAV1WTU0_LUPLU
MKLALYGLFSVRISAPVFPGKICWLFSLLHDDVLDDADTRHDIGSLNVVMGNKHGTLYAKDILQTPSLISNSYKAIAILAGQTAEVAMLAFDYGKNMGLAFQLIDDVLDFTGTSASLGKGSLSDICHGIVTAPMLFAMEEFPHLRAIVDEGFENPKNIDLYSMMPVGRPARPFEMPMGELGRHFRANGYIFHALPAQNMQTGGPHGLSPNCQANSI